MKNYSTQKERILQFIDFKGISKNKFYIETGISNGTLDKKSKLSMDSVEKFYSTYPELSPEWILTGRGDMLKEPEITIQNRNRKTTDPKIDIQEVPLYDLEASAGLTELFRNKGNILDTIKIPNIPKCDGALPITGDSMYPLLKSGDIALYKEIPVELQSIFFGEMYLLGIKINDDDNDEMVTAKYVQKSDLGNDYIKLVSQNKHHEPKDIHLKRVTAMAMIKVSIRVNTMF